MQPIGVASLDVVEVEVSFAFKVETTFGSQVFAVGSPEVLGAWRPRAGLLLRTSSDLYPQWVATARLPARTPVEFKFVIMEPDGTQIWEEGPNRVFELQGPSKGAGLCAEVENDDSDEDDDDDSEDGTVAHDLRHPEDAPKPPSGALHPSLGSEAHTSGTCKRCCFFPRGRCTNGYECEFCHYEHEKRKRKNKKKKKTAGTTTTAASSGGAGSSALEAVPGQVAPTTAETTSVYSTATDHGIAEEKPRQAIGQPHIETHSATVTSMAGAVAPQTYNYITPYEVGNASSAAPMLTQGYPGYPMEYAQGYETLYGQQQFFYYDAPSDPNAVCQVAPDAAAQQWQQQQIYACAAATTMGSSCAYAAAPPSMQLGGQSQSNPQMTTQVYMLPPAVSQASQGMTPPPHQPPRLLQVSELTPPPPVQSPKLCKVLAWPGVPPPLSSPKFPKERTEMMAGAPPGSC